jgi:hypothetical protein
MLLYDFGSKEQLIHEVDEATAPLMVAVVRGLLLDRLATGEHDRTDAALRRFSSYLEA